MPYCAVLECKNESRTKNLTKGGISYHRFPKAPDITKKWIDATGRQNWFPSKTSTICSEHFVNQDFLIKKSGNKYIVDTAIPSLKILCFQAQNLSATPSSDNSSTPKGHKRKLVSEDLTNYVTQKKTKIDTYRADSNADFSSAASTPRKIKLNRKLRWNENIIKRQKLQIKRLQTQNRRLKKKVKKIEEILKDLEEKFNISNENITNLKNTNVF